MGKSYVGEDRGDAWLLLLLRGGFVGCWWAAAGAATRWSSRRLCRWNYIGDRVAAVRGERGEGEERQKRRGKEKRREGRGREGRRSPSGLAGAASREGRRIERAAALFFGEEEELIVLGFWGLWFRISFF
ncbi:hypothetical protein MTR67_043862 [Solanum verrucosum]|uniref:Uncharacterized protein n=1 Tax=Solanum verrucosum TaxID=315347 RepID=A0AAF0ZSE8_SOLVR|nr:hypothetical protein MTR67_043862 [Solanum verrucosum]